MQHAHADTSSMPILLTISKALESSRPHISSTMRLATGNGTIDNAVYWGRRPECCRGSGLVIWNVGFGLVLFVHSKRTRRKGPNATYSAVFAAAGDSSSAGEAAAAPPPPAPYFPSCSSFVDTSLNPPPQSTIRTSAAVSPAAFCSLHSATAAENAARSSCVGRQVGW